MSIYENYIRKGASEALFFESSRKTKNLPAENMKKHRQDISGAASWTMFGDILKNFQQSQNLCVDTKLLLVHHDLDLRVPNGQFSDSNIILTALRIHLHQLPQFNIETLFLYTRNLKTIFFSCIYYWYFHYFVNYFSSCN